VAESETSRRTFIVLAGAGAGAAALGVAAQPAAGAASGVAGPFVAHVRDGGGDRIALMVGEREVVIRDRELVTRLARAAASAR
jgi:hypothetical protein